MKRMKKEYILVGLLLLSLNLKATDITLSIESNSSKEEIKRYIVDLDKDLKKKDERGGVSDIIRGIIPLGHNDEVTFIGKKVLIARNLKVYINGQYEEMIKVINRTFTIKTDKLSEGDTLTIQTKRGKVLVEKKITK